MKKTKRTTTPESVIVIPPDIQALLDATPDTKGVAEELQRAYVDLERDPEFVAGFLKMQFVEDILKAMEEQGLNRKKLAEKLGKTRQYVSRVLNEKANFTFETIAEFSCALGMYVAARMYTPHERMAILPALTRPREVLPFPGPHSGTRRKVMRTKMSPKPKSTGPRRHTLP